MTADCVVGVVGVADVACCRVIAAAVSVAYAAGEYVRCIFANTDGGRPAPLVLRTAPKYDGAGRLAVDIVAGGLDGGVGVRAGVVYAMSVAM